MQLLRLTLQLLLALALHAQDRPLRVVAAGSEPFVMRTSTGVSGISVEIWEAMAAHAGWRYQLELLPSVAAAIEAIESGAADVAIGPISITADRARTVRYSLPYFQSSLAIVSRASEPGPWERLAPFFSESFFKALIVLLCILTVVGAVVWTAERRVPGTGFPPAMWRGIGTGIWFAIVTMSTVGYGDLAPRTVAGRIATGIWIIVSLVAATSLIAGIASTLTLTGLRTTTISTAEEMSGATVAVTPGSPAEAFASKWGASLRRVEGLEQGIAAVTGGEAAGFVFDRPQLLYWLQQRRTTTLAVSSREYEHQKYGFVLPLASTLVHDVNVSLLQLEESGRVDRIVASWLGTSQ